MNCPIRSRRPASSSHHIGGQLVSWQVLNVLVLRVDDFSQLPATHFLLVHPHIDGSVEAAGRPHVVSDDPGDSGAPAAAAGEGNRRETHEPLNDVKQQSRPWSGNPSHSCETQNGKQ